ncbi:MAG: DegT/DnrJ/EryC1/StrS family aminotransferase [Burkholderiales bacterium]
MMIPMNAFQREPESLRAKEIDAVRAVLDSGWYILGGQVKAFESAWASRTGTKYAIGVANGMDAIEIGLRCLDIGPGDEVITTPMTAFATVLAIIRAGAIPVLADIDPDTALLDRASVERCIGPKTRALLLVHIYGQVRDMDRWLELCKRENIRLFEDCAQSHLAAAMGEPSGSIGSWGAFSFYPTKNLGAIGDGGALTTNCDEIAAKAKVLRNYGQSVRYHHPVLGMNSRLDEMQAAILRVRLETLEEFTKRRQAIAVRYRAGIGNPRIRLLSAPQSVESHVYHLFVICCDDRNRLADFLKNRGIESLIHYPIPVHLQPPCRGARTDPAGLGNAERFAETCLSIPCHPQLTDDEVFEVVKALNEYD